MSAAASSATSRCRGSARIASTSSPAAPSARMTATGSAATCRETARVLMRDVTSARAVINLCGPLAREVLEKVAEEDVEQCRPALRALHGRSRSARRRCWRCASAMSASSAGNCMSRPSTPRMSTSCCWEAGRGLRHRQRRLPRHRHAAHGEGLSLLEQRHHAGLHAVRGRARLPRRAQERRLHRPRCPRSRRKAEGPRPAALHLHARTAAPARSAARRSCATARCWA